MWLTCNGDHACLWARHPDEHHERWWVFSGSPLQHLLRGLGTPGPAIEVEMVADVSGLPLEPDLRAGPHWWRLGMASRVERIPIWMIPESLRNGRHLVAMRAVNTWKSF